jgi:hypothetical protein
MRIGEAGSRERAILSLAGCRQGGGFGRARDGSRNYAFGRNGRGASSSVRRLPDLALMEEVESSLRSHRRIQGFSHAALQTVITARFACLGDCRAAMGIGLTRDDGRDRGARGLLDSYVTFAPRNSSHDRTNSKAPPSGG